MDTVTRKPDRTLLIVIATVVALVVVALVVVFTRGGAAPLDESTPAGVVQRYTQAVVAGDQEAAREARKGGFDAMKVYPVAPARALEGGSFVRETEELVGVVRDAAGEDADVMVDLHGRTSPAMAIRIGHELEPYRPWWLEEPCQPGNVGAMAEVARALTIPIATGERLVMRGEFRELLDARACAIVEPNVCYCGGVSEFRRIAAMAETAMVAVAPHNPNGPIGTMVSVHLALALPNVLILEHVRDDVPWRREIVDAPLETTDGYADPPMRPGIGVELIEEVAAAHVGRSPRPHLEFGPDGALLDW